MSFETKFRNFVGRTKTTAFTQSELIYITNELLAEYNEERKISIESWKGKSSFGFVEVGDNIVVTKYQRPEKGAEPKEVHTTISLKELNIVRYAINKALSSNPGYVKSTAIAETVYSLPWKQIFSNRKRHNKFTIMLNVLEKKGFIEYRGGRIYGA